MEEKLQQIFDRYRNSKGSTIVVLQEIQNLYKFLPEDALKKYSDEYKIPISEIYGVATFYSQFKFVKPGENQIKVCHGTACHINGADRISAAAEESLGIKAGETTKDGKFSIEDVACLGCCSLAPVIMVNENVYAKLDDKGMKKIIKEY